MSGAPWLLLSHGRVGAEYTKHSLYDVTENNTCYHADPEPSFLNEKRVIGSTSHGWLVLADDGDYWLWHPISGSRIQLPPLDTSVFHAFVLTKPPTEPDCHIIFTARRSNVIAYCRIGDDAFKTVYEKVIVAMRSLRGRIYGVEALLHGFRLVSIEIVGAELLLKPIFKLKGTIRGDSIYGEYLVESEEGELLLVYKIQPNFRSDHSFGFRVFQVSPERRESVEVESIGDRTLFVADFGNSFCCSAIANKTKPNCVYYARAQWRSLYIYNMCEGSTATVLPSPAVHRYKPYNSWIQQHHSLTTYFHHIS